MSRLRKLVTGTLGSEIAEAALVLPIFFMIMLGIYWFGRAFNIYATINHAAREGARLAVAPHCSTCAGGGCSGGYNCPVTIGKIGTQVAQALQASGLDPGQAQPLGGTRAACGGGSSGCQTPGAGPNICVYYNVQLQSSASLPTGSGVPACGVSVQFRYPYQFYLPFTSLNMQKIMLNAGVQMAAEY